nr:PQQ-dependent dehydrogenase, methanol/ethanol family [Mesorhizobium loti]
MRIALSSVALAAITVSSLAQSGSPSIQEKSYSGATASFAGAGRPGEWTSQARDYANTRFSPLSQINSDNVAKLKIAWTFSDGTQYGHEGAPLVIGDTMFVVTPYPNTAYALDLSKPGPSIKWKFDPNPSPQAIGKACCDAVIRGWAYADGKLIYNMLDDHTVAVDAATGKEVWRTSMDDVKHGVTMTQSAFAADGKVFVGNSGGEMGVNGWLAALDVATGKEIWRAHAVGSDKDVRIDDNFRPFYAWLKGKDLGINSWPANAWNTGAGASWGFVSYDEKTKTVYYGTSNPGPRVPAQRPGDNLWTSAMFARDPETGKAKWAYQFTPHDQWDYDGVNEAVLLDMPIDGRLRQTLVHFDRNTYAYTIDRNTGEVLLANNFAYQNWSTGFDMKTGRPIVDPAREPKPGVKIDRVCPPDIGQKDWEPPAFSPNTGLLYVGVFNICMGLTDHEVSYIAGTPYDGMEMERFSVDGPNGKWGGLIAWDPAHGKKIWEVPEKFMVMSGVIATASDLVFYGTTDGWFRAVDAWTGKVLWSQKLGSGIIGQPMTYMGPDNRQYVAVAAGVGGAAMVQKARPGFLPRGNTIYVFSVDGDTIQTAGDETPTAVGTVAAQK